MRGLDWDDPLRIRSWRELIGWINEVGISASVSKRSGWIFRGGACVEPVLVDGDPEQDPWIWREIIARSGEDSRALRESFSAVRQVLSAGSGFRFLPTTAGTAMTLTPGGRMSWPISGTKRLWTAFRGKKNTWGWN